MTNTAAHLAASDLESATTIAVQFAVVSTEAKAKRLAAAVKAQLHSTFNVVVYPREGGDHVVTATRSVVDGWDREDCRGIFLGVVMGALSSALQDLL